MEITKIESSKNSYLKESKIKTKKYSERFEREIINIYPEFEKQEVLGFGGAITESVGYCYSLLPQEKKDSFIREYFDNNYSFVRLCVASSDFSIKGYSYSKKKDLSDFSIEHDLKYVIPMVKDALKFNPNIRFIASPWSPPGFMKTIKIRRFGGHLKKKYYQTYSEYLAKFILAYKEQGINIDFLNIQNETYAIQIWESCLYSPEQEEDFIVNYLSPTFSKNNIDTKILIHDHNKEKIFNKARKVFENPTSRDLIDGISFHWYSGDHYDNIKLVRKLYPEKLLIHSEGCFGYTKDECNYHYAQDIIDDFNNETNAYLDWNILLDSNGGPTHVKNFCMAPIMLNKENTDYIKSLNYYFIQHFSRFIKPGSKIIENSKYSRNLSVLAAKNKDGKIIVVVLNDTGSTIQFRLCMNDISFKDKIAGHSIITYKI